MISKLESFSFLPFCLLSISAYRFDVNNPASFGVMFVTRHFFLPLIMNDIFSHAYIVSIQFDSTGSVVWVPASFSFLFYLHTQRKDHILSPSNGDDNSATKKINKRRRIK